MFIFKLEAILKYRRQIENLCKQQLAQEKKQWEKERKQLERYREMWNQSIAEFRHIQEDRPNVAAMSLFDNFMYGLKKNINNQAKKVIACSEEMEKKRQALFKASMERKIIDKLKEKSRTQFLEAQSKKEIKFLDDMTIQRFFTRGHQ